MRAPEVQRDSARGTTARHTPEAHTHTDLEPWACWRWRQGPPGLLATAAAHAQVVLRGTGGAQQAEHAAPQAAHRRAGGLASGHLLGAWGGRAGTGARGGITGECGRIHGPAG
jgi:hypothetical protein